jgi:drug/metabolite transporter (DMT)-like permease
LNSLLLAFAAILIWSSLALLGSFLNSLPPFLLLGIAFSVPGIFSLIRRKGWHIPFSTLLVGVAGIFGYHFLYFRGFTHAPPVEANLINYLWPLLIVLLSPVFLRGYRLGIQHLVGGLLGLAGAVLIISRGQLIHLDVQYLPGYLLSAGAAVTWALYSLLTKKLPPFPTDSVGVFCLFSAVLSFTAFWIFGGSLANITALTLREWLLLLILGVGPMGSAFFLWDAALKAGDPRSIGALAYLTPMMSTLNLLVFGGQRLTWISGLAMLLIVAGAIIGNATLQRPLAAKEPSSGMD